jgi:hypothetical protein
MTSKKKTIYLNLRINLICLLLITLVLKLFHLYKMPMAKCRQIEVATLLSAKIEI